MESVYITANVNKPDVKKIAVKLIKWLAKKKIKIFLHNDIAKLLRKKAGRPARESIDLYVSLGGDGTFLNLVRTIHPTQKPVIGINLGSLGFLAEVKLEKMINVLDEVLKGNYNIDKRMVLESTCFGKKIAFNKLISLNDIVISGIEGRLIKLDVHINSEYVTTYSADGLIVSTPTGSTAYSLSAGGPIVNPRLHAIILTPICPHTLTNRPIIITGDSIVEIFINIKNETVKVVADGQKEYLLKGENIIRIKKSEYPVNLIIPSKNSFYKILREKLHWG